MEITGESLPFLPLRLLGLAHSSSRLFDPASVPRWANAAAVAGQLVSVLAVLAAAAIAPNLKRATAMAAMAPVVFLLTNRVFGARYFVMIVAAWAFSAALVGGGEHFVLVVGVLGWGASLANFLVFPVFASHWPLCSGALFVLAFAATSLLVARAASPHGVAPISSPRVAESRA
jgi:hypothetical protein